MSRADPVQFNVRSAFVRKRAHELAKLTGLTATQVMEDALRGYVPSGVPTPVEGLVRRGAILVKPAGVVKVSAAEADAALEAVRERSGDD
jgi:hypothetical protein